MLESGQSWRRQFEAHPASARLVRRWAACRLEHPDAPQVANELFVSILAAGGPAVEMTLSTAGPRSRITAVGSRALSLLHSHGPGYLIVSGLASVSGTRADGLGVWAQLTTKDERSPA
ncbi:hypothetical protein ACFYPZ_24460 [Streptomyces sp. NPDC005506]|uniref:hypothetical protein n=1 Tax=Streptomyces sp. NPDC005506 TaxID=3364718 RepID=UPI003679F123